VWDTAAAMTHAHGSDGLGLDLASSIIKN